MNEITYDENSDDDSFERVVEVTNSESQKKKLEFVKTTRGGQKLPWKGYFYNCESCNKTAPPNEKNYWKCERTGSKNRPKCGGRAYTINFYEPVVVSVDHNHEPEPERLACLKVVNQCKSKAVIQPNDNPRSIINACQTELDEESSRAMTRQANLVIIIHLARNTKPENQMNANDIEDIVTMLPEQLKYSYRNELFLLGTFVVWYF